MLAMIQSNESATEPITPVAVPSSSVRRLRQAQEINKYINEQVIMMPTPQPHQIQPQ